MHEDELVEVQTSECTTGKRTNWVTNAAPNTGEALAVASTFNRAGQITSENRSRPDGVTSIGYSYNSAGQRTAQSSWGPDETSTVTYAYTGAGRLASALQGDSLTTFGYDGLGRSLTTTTETSYGSEATTAVWDGMSVVQQTSDISGRATLLRDALGQVALQSTTPGDTSAAAAWSLQDRLGSTVAQTTTSGRITDLASYSDFGVPSFNSTGFAASTGFTGELSDATTGLNSYFSRTYDPFNATWLTADTYRGTLANPASQNRYGYVEGNPATMVDALGFATSHASFDGNDVGQAPKKSSSVKTPPPAGCVRNNCAGGTDNPSDESATSARHLKCASPGPRGVCYAPMSQEQKDNQIRGIQGVGALLAGVACLAVITLCALLTTGAMNTAAGAARDARHTAGQDRTLLGDVGAWALGTPVGSGTYGWGSAIVDGLRQQSETQAARDLIVAGRPTAIANYSSHDDLLGGDLWNLPRDICTAAAWDTNCFGIGNQTKAALGSYSLQATPVFDDFSGELIGIHFEGSNTYTLGSALGIPPTEPLIGAWNNYSDRTGVGQPAIQHFEWTEPIQ